MNKLMYWKEGEESPQNIEKFKGGKDLKHPVTGKQLPATYFQNMSEAECAEHNVYYIRTVEPELGENQYYGKGVWDRISLSYIRPVLDRTQEWIDNKAKQEAEDKRENYSEYRRKEYPSVGDQLDALWKHYNGDSTDADAIKAEIDAVKAKYPK
jgi:hypothetical protein